MSSPMFTAECQLGWEDEPEDYNVAYHRAAAEEAGSPHSRGRALGKDGVQYCVTDWDDGGSLPLRPSGAARRSMSLS